MPLFKSTSRFILAVSLTMWTVFGIAQIRSGAIVGRIVDPTNAPIPDVQVKVITQGTNVQFQTVTNSAGEYTVPYLPAGEYTVRVAASGFTSAEMKNIHLGTAETLRADLKLELGTVATAVEVAGSATTLQTESSTVQNAIGEKVIQSVPNINRNPFYYATLQAGVVPRAAFSDTRGVNSFGVGTGARRQFTAISVNGGLAFTNDIMLDGVSIQGPTWNEATVLPNSEGVQEVRTLVNNYSAEFGRGQGVITVTTKSGANERHGSVFGRYRNDALNANSFENNLRRIPKPVARISTYGATFGGPIKKDTFFFFVSYEGLRNNQGVDYFRTVPTALERKGDFSDTVVNVNGKSTPLRLFDPWSAVQTEPNVYRRTPVPRAIISNPDVFAMKLLSFYPLPNRTADDAFGTNNYYYRGPQTFRRNSVNTRLDYRWKDHSLYGTGGIFQGSIDTASSWGDASYPFHSATNLAGGGYGLTVKDRNPFASIGDTLVLSPSLVLDLRYGIARTNVINLMGAQDNFNYDQFGIPKSIQAINPLPGAPPVSSYGGTWSPLQNDTPNQKQYGTNHQLVGSLTKSVSRWTFKLGGEYRVYLSNYFSAKGTIYLGGTSTTVGDSSAAAVQNYTRETVNASGAGVGTVTADQAGFGPASFLFGVGTTAVAPGSSFSWATYTHKYIAAYSQNDWRATSRLTVNLGIRWDLQPGPTDRYNEFCAFDPAGRNPFFGNGGYVCPGVNGSSRNLWQAPYNNFGPRVGFAYRVTDTLDS